MPRPIYTLLPYQARWVRDRAALKVCEKGRRIGLSWAEAYDSVMHAGIREGGGNVYYQSFDHEMTRGFVSDCTYWAEGLGHAISSSGETLLEEGGDLTFRLEMASGHEIVAITSATRGLRSKGRPGDRAIVDEAAFLDNLPEVLKSALAFLQWGGAVRVVSTHNGVASAFNRLVCDVREGGRPGSLHTIPFGAARDDGLYRRICDVSGQRWSPGAEAAWEAGIRAIYGENAAEELDCIPASGAGAWLPWDVIRRAEDAGAGRPDLHGGGPAYVGVDVARRRDLWVAVAVERDGGRLWVRELATLRDVPFAVQHATLARLVDAYRPVRVAIDQTGMGEETVERAQAAHGRHRVEGVLLTAPRRLDVATALKEALEDERLRIPDDPALRDDLHSVRVEAGPSGAPRLVADRSGTDGHADRFWALALAVAAAAETPRRYAYHPVGLGAPRGRRDRYADDIDDLPSGRWAAFAGGGLGRLGNGRGLP